MVCKNTLVRQVAVSHCSSWACCIIRLEQESEYFFLQTNWNSLIWYKPDNNRFCNPFFFISPFIIHKEIYIKTRREQVKKNGQNSLLSGVAVKSNTNYIKKEESI